MTEVMSVIRGHVLGSTLSVTRADEAVTTLADLTISVSDCQSLLNRIWQLRHNLTAYDAAHIALAESFHVPLVTSDVRLSGASGITCTTITIQ